MKRFLGLCLLLALTTLPSQADVNSIFGSVYGAHTSECTSTTMDATNANVAGPFVAGKLYMIYGYTSSVDFTGVAMKCIQGPVSVTVNAKEGMKFTAGEKQIWIFKTNQTYISCQTGSLTGVYDVCKQD